MGGEGRSLFDVGNKRSGFVGGEGAIAFMGVELRSQFDVGEICDRIYWVVRVRSLFDVGNRRSGLGDDGAIAV